MTDFQEIKSRHPIAIAIPRLKGKDYCSGISGLGSASVSGSAFSLGDIDPDSDPDSDPDVL
jgi:hypothetical protein